MKDKIISIAFGLMVGVAIFKACSHIDQKLLVEEYYNYWIENHQRGNLNEENKWPSKVLEIDTSYN